MKISPEAIKDLAVESDDFGHEMRVGSVLNSMPRIGTVQHGGTYSDPATGLARQFDYRLRIETGNRAVVCAVECKNLGNKPLVVCGAPRTREEAFHELIAVLPPGQYNSTFVDGWSSRAKRYFAGDSPYPVGSFVGKSSFRVGIRFRGQKNQELAIEPDGDVYERWAQALSSCHDLCQIAGNGAALKKKFACYYLALPVLAVPNDSLWVLEYDSSGTPKANPRQTDHCEYFVSRSISVMAGNKFHNHNLIVSHLHIATIAGLTRLCKELGTGGVPERVDGQQDISFWGRYFPHIDPLIH